MAAEATRLELMRRSMSRSEWYRLAGLAAIVVGLHVVGFGVLFLVVAPHYSAVLGAGVGLTAWGFGLRHAFDADHIAAIDNTTRKLMADGKRPLAVGFFFSLGHSTIVFALAFGLAFFAKNVAGEIHDPNSGLHNAGGYIGTSVAALFLYLIAALNLVILIGIIRIFRELRLGRYDEETLEKRLNDRGLINRVLGPLARSVKSSWHMYPVGLLFGLGFDTATEVGLLALAATAGGASLPWYAILCLPVLFAAGMCLMDTADGAFMSKAYGWAFSNPVRKVFYNLAITGLSVAVALIVGTIELISILGSYTGHATDTEGYWGFLNSLDLNTIGFVIVGMFVATWVLAVSLWFFGGVEERWAVASASARNEAAVIRSTHASKPPALIGAQIWMTAQAAVIGIGVLGLGIHDALPDGAATGATRALLVATIACGSLAVALSLVRLAIGLDRSRGVAAWIAAVALEALCLVVGIATANGVGGGIRLAEIGLPLVALVLLLSRRTLLHLRSAQPPMSFRLTPGRMDRPSPWAGPPAHAGERTLSQPVPGEPEGHTIGVIASSPGLEGANLG